MTPRCGRSPQRGLESESEVVGKPLKERTGEELGEDERFVKRRKQPDTTAPHSPIAGKIARITRSISMTMGGDDADSGVLEDERQKRGGHGELLNVEEKPDEQKELSGTIHHDDDNEDDTGSTNKKMVVAMPPAAFPAPDFAGDPSLIDSLAEKLNGMPPFWSDFECFVYENSNDTRSAARVLEAFNAKHSALIKNLNLEQIDRLCGEIAKLFLSEETIQSASSETPEAAAATTTTTSI